MKNRKCVVCDKTLPENKRCMALYCSSRCRNKVRIGILKAQRQALREPKKCLMCENFILRGKRRCCSEVCDKKLALNSRHRHQETSKLRLNELKKKLTFLAGDCCQSCGYNNNYAALQFHHIDPKQKLFSLNVTSIQNFNWEKVVEEMGKCLLLCANCHLELHHPKRERVDITPQHNQDPIIFYPFAFVS